VQVPGADELVFLVSKPRRGKIWRSTVDVIKLGGASSSRSPLPLSATLLLAQSGKVEVLWFGQATFRSPRRAAR